MMKSLIFLIVVGLVVSAIIWKIRKSQAEADLARRKDIERRRKEEKEAMTPEVDMIWPVVIRPLKSQGSPGGPSRGAQGAEEPAVEEPMMTSIEFVPAQEKVPGKKTG